MSTMVVILTSLTDNLLTTLDVQQINAMLDEVYQTREVKVKSYLPAALSGLTCIERSDGSGDLLFEGEDVGQRRFNQGFITIERVREVEQTLRQALHL